MTTEKPTVVYLLYETSTNNQTSLEGATYYLEIANLWANRFGCHFSSIEIGEPRWWMEGREKR